MSRTPSEVAEALNITLFDWQAEALAHWLLHEEVDRLCLYYRTGSGKTDTALGLLAVDGYEEVR